MSFSNARAALGLGLGLALVALAGTDAAACDLCGTSWHFGTGLTPVKGVVDNPVGWSPSAEQAGPSASSEDRGAPWQVLYLDFDSGVDGNIVYTAAMRDAIRDQIAAYYADFNVSVTNTLPGAGPFSKVTFNAGGTGGVAQHIDFRNTDKNDTAVVNIVGLGFTTTAQYIAASAGIGAHEFGHLLGLRHGDSYGAIGKGISPAVNATNYLPTYPGPKTATETNDHLMASPASVGSSVNDLLSLTGLSERSAIKLAFSQIGTTITEAAGAKNTLATAQPITLSNITVPNTITTGMNAGPDDFSVDALSITGSLPVGGEFDYYRFDGAANDLLNIELMSGAIGWRLGNTIDSIVSVFDSTGTLIPYYSGTAQNDDELEGLDSILIDLKLPANGTYYVRVNAFSGTDTGNYELYMHRFNGFVPTPGAFALLTLGLTTFGARRRRN